MPEYEGTRHGVTKAAQLIEPLSAGLALMEGDRQRFVSFNSPNGWGSYDDFVPWVRQYLQACRDNPNADVSVCIVGKRLTWRMLVNVDDAGFMGLT